MDLFSPKILRQKADDAMGGASCDPRGLAMRYGAVAAIASLLAVTIGYLLSMQVENATGISGLQTRSFLETAQAVLQILMNLLLPFWELGMVFVGVRLIQDRNAVPGDLLEGFRRFGSALRLFFLEGLVFMLLGILCTYAGTAVFMATPLAAPMIEALQPMMESLGTLTGEITVDETMIQTVSVYMRPALYIVGVLFCLVALPLFFRFRMAQFCLLSDGRCGAFSALRQSVRNMKGKRLKLLRLDLSFWWYYAIMGLAMAVCYGDVILRRAGIDLPVPESVQVLGFYGIYALALFLLQWYARAKVETTYCAFYETAASGAVSAPEEKPVPKSLPWD